MDGQEEVMAVHVIMGKTGEALSHYRLLELGEQWHFQEQSHGLWFTLMPKQASREDAMQQGRAYVRAKRGWKKDLRACLVATAPPVEAGLDGAGEREGVQEK